MGDKNIWIRAKLSRMGHPMDQMRRGSLTSRRCITDILTEPPVVGSIGALKLDEDRALAMRPAETAEATYENDLDERGRLLVRR